MSIPYIQLLSEIKQRIRAAQYKALQAVNEELIGLLRKRLVGTPGAGAQPKPRASWLIPGLSTKG